MIVGNRQAELLQLLISVFPPYGDFRKRLVASFFHGAFLVLQRVKMFARMVCSEKCPKEPSVRRRGVVVVVVVGVSKIISAMPK